MSKQSLPGDQILIEMVGRLRDEPQCDADPLWGPLVFLRPAKEKPLGVIRLALTCALFGGFYGMCANVVFVLAFHLGGRAAPPLLVAPLFLTLSSLLCGQLFFAPAWNRRVRLLARRQEWAAANRRDMASWAKR